MFVFNYTAGVLWIYATLNTQTSNMSWDLSDNRVKRNHCFGGLQYNAQWQARLGCRKLQNVEYLHYLEKVMLFVYLFIVNVVNVLLDLFCFVLMWTNNIVVSQRRWKAASSKGEFQLIAILGVLYFELLQSIDQNEDHENKIVSVKKKNLRPSGLL